MAKLEHAVRAGHYAQHQLYSRDRLVAWSHRRRFGTALQLAQPFAGKRLLDYGCGDGTFLGLLMSDGGAPAAAVGADLDEETIIECQQRLAGNRALRFVRTADLRGSEHDHAFDSVFCMEVLEHVVDSTPLLDDFERLLAPSGALIVSVPIETGFPLIVKQIVRRVAGWRGVGYYPGTTGYTPRELLTSVLAGSTQHVPRPVFTREDQTTFHDHKGFNWKALRSMLAARFDLIRTLTSPVSWLGPQLGTQIWFVARQAPSKT